MFKIRKKYLTTFLYCLGRSKLWNCENIVILFFSFEDAYKLPDQLFLMFNN